MPKARAALIAVTLATLGMLQYAFGQVNRPETEPTAPAIAPIVDRGPHKVEYGKNYKIIRMHYPRNEEDAVVGPSLAAANEGGNIVILNYTDRTNPKSAKQLQWLQEALPALAQRSKRPIILADITAFDKDFQRNVIYTAFAPSLIVHLEKWNTLNNGRKMPFNLKTDAMIVPYGMISYAGNKNKAESVDFSTSLYPASATDAQLRGAVLTKVIRVIKASNEAIQRD